MFVHIHTCIQHATCHVRNMSWPEACCYAMPCYARHALEAVGGEGVQDNYSISKESELEVAY